MSNLTISDPFISLSGAGQAFSVLSTGSITALGATTNTTIDSYTAVGNDRIIHIIASGTNYAKFTVELNTTVIATLRTGPGRNAFFPLNLGLSAADIIDIKVEHFQTGETNDFEATFIGFT